MAGVVTGPFPIHEGVQEIRNGELVLGSDDLASGTANTSASLSLLGGRMVPGTSLLAAGDGIDGGSDLYKGIKTTNTTQIAIGGVERSINRVRAAECLTKVRRS